MRGSDLAEADVGGREDGSAQADSIFNIQLLTGRGYCYYCMREWWAGAGERRRRRWVQWRRGLVTTEDGRLRWLVRQTSPPLSPRPTPSPPPAPRPSVWPATSPLLPSPCSLASSQLLLSRHTHLPSRRILSSTSRPCSCSQGAPFLCIRSINSFSPWPPTAPSTASRSLVRFLSICTPPPSIPRPVSPTTSLTLESLHRIHRPFPSSSSAHG